MRARSKPGRGAGSRAIDRDPGRRAPNGESGGFSLVEVLVGIIVTSITIVGLAHLFGNGRALINHYEVARAAYGVAQQRFELLGRTGTSADLSIGLHPGTPNSFAYGGANLGTESWSVAWYDDPIDGTGIGDTNPNDLKLVAVSVRWGQGVEADSVRLTRLFPSVP